MVVHSSFLGQQNLNAGRVATPHKGVQKGAIEKNVTTFAPANWRSNSGSVFGAGRGYIGFTNGINGSGTPKIVIENGTQSTSSTNNSTLEKLAKWTAIATATAAGIEALDKAGAFEGLGKLFSKIGSGSSSNSKIASTLQNLTDADCAQIVSKMQNATTSTDLETAITEANNYVTDLGTKIENAEANCKKLIQKI